jgi:hypothetical protein
MLSNKIKGKIMHGVSAAMLLLASFGVASFLFTDQILTDLDTLGGQALQIYSEAAIQDRGQLEFIRTLSIFATLFGIPAGLVLGYSSIETHPEPAELAEQGTGIGNKLFAILMVSAGVVVFFWAQSGISELHTLSGAAQSAIDGSLSDDYDMYLLGRAAAGGLITMGLLGGVTILIYMNVGERGGSRSSGGSPVSVGSGEYCHECGSELPDQGNFCTKCGAKKVG